MFAVLFTEVMDPIYKVLFAFPTVVFAFLFTICLIYWLFTLLGVLDISVLDVDIDVSDGADSPGMAAGVLLKFGLHNIPFIFVLTAVSMFGLFFSYIGVSYSQSIVPEGFLQYLSGFVIFVGVLLSSFVLTSFCLKPLKPVFAALTQSDEKIIIGQIAVVRSAKVDAKSGEAMLDDGGAGLILKVRCYDDTDQDVIRRGDRVAIIEHDEALNTYSVISENEFHR